MATVAAPRLAVAILDRWMRLIIWVVLAPALCNGANMFTAAPEAIQLCPGASEFVRIVATSDSDDAFSKATLRWHTAGNVTVSPQPVVDKDARASKKYAAWLLKVTAPSSAMAPETVHVFLVGELQASAREVLASTSFKVGNAIGTEAFPAKLELDSTWKNLNEGQRARAQVIITNQSAGFMQVTGIRISSGPFDVAGIPTDGKDPAPLQKSDLAYVLPVPAAELAPGSAMVRTFDVFVASSARPASGKHRVLVATDVTTTLNGCKRSATLVASSELGFAVLGNEIFLTAVGIPSFLVMPGFLILMTCLLLWKFGLKPARAAAGAAFPFVPKEAEFWVLAVTLSLPLVLLPGAPDRFANYRIDDVAHVWFCSLVVAIAFYLIIVFVMNLIDRIATARLLSENDDVKATLLKLSKRAKTTIFPMVEVDLAKATLGSGTTLRFLVPKQVPGDRWTLPGVVYDWKGARDTALQSQIEAARNDRHLPRLVDVLRRGAEAGKITLQWDPGAKLKRPVRIASTALTEQGDAEFVQESA